MKAFTKRIFGAVEPRYLTRAYLISLALLIYVVSAILGHPDWRQVGLAVERTKC